MASLFCFRQLSAASMRHNGDGELHGFPLDILRLREIPMKIGVIAG